MKSTRFFVQFFVAALIAVVSFFFGFQFGVNSSQPKKTAALSWGDTNYRLNTCANTANYTNAANNGLGYGNANPWSWNTNPQNTNGYLWCGSNNHHANA